MAADSVNKRPRLESRDNFSETSFLGAFNEDLEDCAKIPCRCLTFILCNAATSDSYSFSEAVCETKPLDDYYAFGTFFENGIVLLKQYVEDPMKAIESVHEKALLQRLLSFTADEGNQECILKVIYDRTDVSEGNLSATLANHLFSKLALNERYTLNKSYERWNKCPCGCNEKIQQYGDTSFGNETVWHGCTDILVNESSVAVRNFEVCHDSPERASVGMIKGFEIVKKRVHNQLTSQTVCFSFLQGHRHPEYQNTLVPCIGISSSEVMIYMYDSVKDVLVQSCVLNLFEDDKRQICTSTVIAVWLAINYKVISSFSNSVSNFIQTMPHANFLEVAKDKLHIYQEQLKLGSVGNPPAPKLFRRGGPKQISHLKGSEKMRLLGITNE